MVLPINSLLCINKYIKGKTPFLLFFLVSISPLSLGFFFSHLFINCSSYFLHGIRASKLLSTITSAKSHYLLPSFTSPKKMEQHKSVMILVTLKRVNYITWSRLTITTLGERGLWEHFTLGAAPRQITEEEDGKEIVVVDEGK